MSSIDRISAGLDAIRKKHPLVHNITNYVVMNSTANSLLALGASPVMAHAIEEVEEMVSISSVLVINIGTLSKNWIEAMFKAGHAAREHKVPIVLDPVGAGATRLRTETARQLMVELKPDVLRGNASEIMALAKSGGFTRGVDSGRDADEALEAAMELAANHGNVVSVTGAVDIVTDGRRRTKVKNGHPLMARITGSGCAVSSIIGALCGVCDNAYDASVAGLVIYGIAGEMAASDAPGSGTFQVKLIDALNEIQENDLRRGIRIEEF